MSYLYAEKLTCELFIPQFFSKEYIYFALLRTYCFSFARCLYRNSLSKTRIFALLKTFCYINLLFLSLFIVQRMYLFCPAYNALLYSIARYFFLNSLSKQCIYFVLLLTYCHIALRAISILIYCRSSVFIFHA